MTKKNILKICAFIVVYGMLSLVVANAAGVTLLPSPTPKFKTLPQFIQAILGIVVKIGITIIALAFVYSGYLFVSAQGDTKKIESARSVFFWTVIGGAIVLGAWMLSKAIENTIRQLGPLPG